MNPLKSRFAQVQAALRNNLVEATTLSDVIAILQTEVRGMRTDVFSPSGSDQIEKRQVGAALCVIFEQSIGFWACLYPESMRISLAPQPRQAATTWKEAMLSHVEVLPAVAVGAGVSTWLGGPLGFGAGLLAGSVTGFAAVVLPGLQNDNARKESRPDTVEIQLQMNIDRLMDGFSQICVAIDEVVGGISQTSEPPPVSGNFSLREEHDLLAFFQSLFAAGMDENKKDRSDFEKLVLHAENVLSQYGITKVIFDPGTAGIDDEASRRLFDVEQSRNPKRKEPLTILPALVKDNQVFLRGRVIVPQKRGNQ